ncbi:MAG: S8 family serine peptidase [Burkholderiaceae bacterium]
MPSLSSSAATTDRFIVKLRDPAADVRARLPAIASSMGTGFTYVRPMSGGAHVIRANQAISLSAARALTGQLMLDSNIAYIEPDRKLYPMLAPNDTLYSQQWNLYEAVGGINMPAAWNVTTGAAGVVIAVIDTGFRPHGDLAGRLLPGYDFINDTAVSNDGDGRDADASDPGDYGCNGGGNSTWHGTHVAGIAAAASNNGTGVAGINWVSKILPARVLGRCGGYTSDIADAMRWSAGISVPGVPANPNPARVENLSLGGSGTCSATFQSAVDDVVARGTVVVVAAGNDGADAASTDPASCNNVIAVAASTRAGGKASFSNFGSKVALAAPGTGILSTLNTGTTVPGADTYVNYSGTSMATPHVAGVASLLLSQNPALTPAQVKSRLQLTARAFPTGTGGDCTTALCGAGIVDAGAALGTAVPPPPVRVNLAAQANGGVASASTSYDGRFPPSGANNGDRRGLGWESGGGWNDATENAYPDWIRIDLASAQPLTEIDVFTIQDGYQSPVEPTEATTFSQYGITAFDVQYWNGSTWITVPNGSVTGNNKVWSKFAFAPITTTSVRVQVNAALAGFSRVVEIEAYKDAAPINAARPSNGGSVSASSVYNSGFSASGAVDGDRRGLNWESGGGWNDATANAYPDTLQVTFNATKSINEIDVFTLQDNYRSPVEPTDTMTFSLYGITDFDVQYWDGSTWVTVSGGAVSGNNKVWRKFTFTPVSTTAIRVNVRNALAGFSRITEVEAWIAQ